MTRKKRGVDGEGDFFGFGKSLTVKGQPFLSTVLLQLSASLTKSSSLITEGILTVADELLQNNGQKFLEMMEQLADKRIQREREAAEAFEDDPSDEEEERSDGGEEDGEYE